MNYMLNNYADYTEEQEILAAISQKKAKLEKEAALLDVEISDRINIIKNYFLRLSWIHKKEFTVSVLKQIRDLDILLEIITFISTLFGKMATYADVIAHTKEINQQILVDHDRTMERQCLTEMAVEDIKWMGTLDETKQMTIIMDFLTLGGGGLMRKLYLPLITIYNRKIIEAEKIKEEAGNKAKEKFLEDLFNDTQTNDFDTYPQDHPLSIEVEKMRKKWDEMMDKYRREIFGPSIVKESIQKNRKLEKSETKAKTTKGFVKEIDNVDWLQRLPIWVVKKIFGYLDQKTLLNIKRVNPYWSYASDSVLKEKQAQKYLDQSIEKMRRNVDPEILKQFDEETLKEFYSSVNKLDDPRQERLKKLMNRGAILKQMVPKVEESQQVQDNFVTNIPRTEGICTPLDSIKIFPRLIKEDLLLYKSYPCHLKDVNIIIDVHTDIHRQRDTLRYTLSQQLSDIFSESEMDIADCYQMMWRITFSTSVTSAHETRVYSHKI